MKALGQSKKSLPSKSERDESEESSDDGPADDLSGDDEKEFVSSLRSLATSPREKKPMAKNSQKESAKTSKSLNKNKNVKELENNQMVVKVLDLKGESKDAISVDQQKKLNVSSAQSKKPETKKSSFFMGGESDSENNDEVQR